MIRIDDSCVGCGICVKDCIAQRIVIENKKAHVTGPCLECGHCVAICPRNAVSIPEYDMEDVEDCEFSLDPEDLLGSIKSRRSIRNYKPQTVEQDKLDLLLQAGRYTATAKNSQDCQFVFVQKELDTFKELIWKSVDEVEAGGFRNIPKDFLPYVDFNRRRKKNPQDDYLFRNAPVVLLIASDYPLDAGLAAQNMELMANALDLGALYNGFLARLADRNDSLKEWLGIPGKTINACMLLGYPNVYYLRTAPRKKAEVIFK